MRKRENVIKFIREMKVADATRRSCFICNRWQSITHCHHVVSVRELADWCVKNDFHSDWLPITFVWLCPNHHEWLHRFRDKRKGEWRSMVLLDDLNEDEQKAYTRLYQIELAVEQEMAKRLRLVQGAADFWEQWHIMDRYIDEYASLENANTLTQSEP